MSTLSKAFTRAESALFDEFDLDAGSEIEFTAHLIPGGINFNPVEADACVEKIVVVTREEQVFDEDGEEHAPLRVTTAKAFDSKGGEIRWESEIALLQMALQVCKCYRQIDLEADLVKKLADLRWKRDRLVSGLVVKASA